MKSLLRFLLAFVLCVGHALAADVAPCPANETLTLPNGQKACYKDFNLPNKGQGTLTFSVASQSLYSAIAISSNQSCKSIGFARTNAPGINSNSQLKDNLNAQAVSECQSNGCQCVLFAEDGRITANGYTVWSQLNQSMVTQTSDPSSDVPPNCSANEVLTLPTGKKTCFKNLNLPESDNSSLSFANASRSLSYYIAISNQASCKAVGYSRTNRNDIFNTSQARDVVKNQALQSCEKTGCKCEIFAEDGRITPSGFSLWSSSSYAGNAIPATPAVSTVATTSTPQEPASDLAEQQRKQAEQLQRLKDESAAVLKERQAREEMDKKARLDIAERDRQQAKALQEIAERDRQQAELRQRLKAEEEARLREQQARQASEQKMSNEQRERERERERLMAENERLRAELANAQKNIKPSQAASLRKAFVVGMDTYKSIPPLVTAREDAKSMATALRGAGFTVSLHLDLGEKDLRAAWRRFTDEVEGGDEVAIFFAGHGVQISGLNYLIPVDVTGESERQIRDDSISLQRLLDDMTERKAKLTLAVIDACRDNPFRIAGRSVGNATRGLAPTSPATGQMVIFSAGSGQRALDNLGPGDRVPNGVFTRVFLKEMNQSGMPIDAIVRKVRSEVVRLSRSVGQEQVPAIYDQMIGEFYLRK